MGRNTNKIVIHNNDIHHNRQFGLSLDRNSWLLISNNKILDNGFSGIQAQLRTSAHIVRNIIFGNKCGGIYIGVNYSGVVHLESNIVRDHSGPWLERQEIKGSLPCSFLPAEQIPPGERELFLTRLFSSKTKNFLTKKAFITQERLLSNITVVARFADARKMKYSAS